MHAWLRRGVVTAFAGGVAVTAFAVRETRNFVLREATIPLLPAGADPLRVLHLSDLHLTPNQRIKREWVHALADLRPDLVVNTGDNMAHLQSAPAVLTALSGLLDVPGVFVRGSNDYFAPSLRNPLGYLMPDDGTRNTDTAELPWKELTATFVAAGWVDLDNARSTIEVGDLTLGFVGVDDPHLLYDDLAAVHGGADPAADVRIAVTHAPYLRVLDQWAAEDHDLIVAGHTHGGQVCLPGGRALATNCDLDKGRAKGLHRHPIDAPPGAPGSSWLHVSAGLGTSPYAPVRLFCRPEATLLTLTARPDF
jgi:predicted MPP superfamily phosphohydrolase